MQKIIVKTLNWLCITAITILTVIILLQVIARILNFTLIGTDELSRLLIVWLTFLGTSLAFHEDMHLSVQYFVNKLDDKKKRFVNLLVNGLLIMFFLIIAFYGVKFSIATMNYVSSSLQLPMSIFYLALPVGALFSIYFLIISTKNIYESKR